MKMMSEPSDDANTFGTNSARSSMAQGGMASSGIANPGTADPRLMGSPLPTSQINSPMADPRFMNNGAMNAAMMNLGATNAAMTPMVPMASMTPMSSMTPMGAMPNTTATGPVIIVCGAAGGVGTSTFSAVMARTCEQRFPAITADQAVILVSAEPDRIGLDMILGLEENAGLRWQDISSPLGIIDARSLIARLPVGDGVRVLAGRPWSGNPPQSWEQKAVFEALLHSSGPLIVDAGNGPQLPEQFASVLVKLHVSDPIILIVVTPTLSALATAQTLIRSLDRLFPQAHIGAVVSRISPVTIGSMSSAPSAGQIAAFLNVPIVAKYSCNLRFAHQIEAGVGLEGVPTSLMRACLKALHRVMEPQRNRRDSRSYFR